MTEKGYCLAADGSLDVQHADIANDAAHPLAPQSVIGYIVEGLRQRRSAGIPPFVLMPCDNPPADGRKLEAAVVALAARQDAALAAWIATRLPCPNTMVDAITPATDDALRDQWAQATGLHDAWPGQREAFAQRVIEAHTHDGGPDWQGAGAVVTPDVAAFERAKLWLLNGPNSTLAYWGSPQGHETVAQAITDLELAAFLQAYGSRRLDTVVAQHRKLVRAIARGDAERLATLNDFRPFIEERLLDVLQPDTGRFGGLTPMRKLAGWAEAHGLLVAPHSGSLGPVAEVAAVHLMATLPNALVLERMDPDWPGRAQVTRTALQLDAGHLLLPQGPGLGVQIDEAFIAAHPSQRNTGAAKGGWNAATEDQYLYLQARQPRAGITRTQA